VAVCSVHPAVPATLQCLGCVKANLAVAKSYHCSSKCFTEAWRLHRAMHVSNDNGGDDDDPIFGRAGTVLSSHGGLAALNGQLPPPSVHSSNARISPARISPAEHVGGETWFEVGRGKSYSPSAEDVGHRLQLECVAVEATTARPVGRALTVFSSHVIPAPSPTPRRFISVNPVNGMSAMEIERRIPAPGTFTLLSYNVLADLYATSDKFSYCPHWALSWAYRKQNLLREIVSYRADILCLQEVIKSSLI
jgi:CCR4-NOT transcription complex subunit 6